MITILFEDNHLYVVSKPAGISTQPGQDGGISLQTEHQRLIKQRDHKPGGVFLHPIHRLDRDASGIVVFCKTQKALSRMHQAVREGKIEKHYQLLVEGLVDPAEGCMEDFLAHRSHRAEVVTSVEGKKSMLHYRVLEQRGRITWAEVHLKTGRYHQIRIQFSSRGHPIVGDVRYGSTLAWKRPGIALHHTACSFVHPVTGQKCCFLDHPNF